MYYVTCIITVIGGEETVFDSKGKKAEGNQLFRSFNMPRNISIDSVPKMIHSEAFDLLTPTLKNYWLNDPSSPYPQAIQDALNMCTAQVTNALKERLHIASSTFPILPRDVSPEIAKDVTIKKGSVSVLVLSEDAANLIRENNEQPEDIPTVAVIDATQEEKEAA